MMLELIAPAAQTPISIAEAADFLKLDSVDEEPVLAQLIRAATGLAERHLGAVLIASRWRQSGPLPRPWFDLRATPVRAIDAVSAADSAGQATLLGGESFSTEINAIGYGRVRLLEFPAGAASMTVEYRAGLSDNPNGTPEPVRLALLRLTAHLYANRDGPGAGLMPADVSASLQPYRRVRLA